MTGRAFGMMLSAVVLMTATTGCGDDDGASLPVATDGEFSGSGFRVDGGGRLGLSEPGCWTVDGIMAAWAPGSSIDEAGRTAATPGGEAVADGSFVRITGIELSTGEWPGGSDGRWARHAEDCGFGSWVMVLVETMEIDPFDPQVTSEAELAALVAETTLTDAVVDSPAGEIPLGTITMTNSCFGCVPG